jgi:hypothetical protein
VERERERENEKGFSFSVHTCRDFWQKIQKGFEDYGLRMKKSHGGCRLRFIRLDVVFIPTFF